MLTYIMSPQYRLRVSKEEGNAGAFDYSEATAKQIDQQVRKLQNEAYQLARRALMADRDKLEGIAKGLLEYQTLDASRTKEIVEHGRSVNPPPKGALPPGKKVLAKNSFGLLGLTARETEVLGWIAQGKTNYEIGVILSACTGTICKHVERILRKLCVENRTAAAAIAIAALANTKK
jgi:DNA-binding NarL/FixJ family response regulator